MTKQNGTVIQPPVARTSAGLRDALFDELDGLRAGSSNPTKASAVAKLAGTVIETVRMELDVQKHLLKHPQRAEAPALGAPVNLGGT